MRRRVLRVLALSLFASLIPTSTQSQAITDSARLARLVALGRLWGVVKYFHPAFNERRVAWDSVTIVAIERTNKARTRGDLELAVNEMLAAVGDEATHVRHKVQPDANDNRNWAWGRRWVVAGRDSTLVIAVPDFDQWQRAMETLDSSVVDIQRAASIVFDLRGPRRDPGSPDWMFSGTVNRYLPTSSLATPAQRRRVHSGFVTQTGTSSGGYWSGVAEQAGETINVDKPNPTRRIVFLVNPESNIPSVAFALRNNGQGAIVVEGDTKQLAAAALTYPVALGDSLEAIIRVGEISGSVDADTALTRTAAEDAPLRVALGYVRRPVVASHTIASQSVYVPQPDTTCASPAYPSTACRVLAAYRWWNTIHYFYPYKHLIGENWSAVLPRSIRNLEAARDSVEYGLAVAEMVSHIHDSHGFISNPTLRNFFGRVPVAVQVQYIGDAPVVISVGDDSATKASGIAVGDVIEAVDGEQAVARRARRARYLSHSTPQALNDHIASRLLWGADSTPARVTVRDRTGHLRTLTVPRRADLMRFVQNPRSGPMLKMLPGNVGYADLSLLPISAVDSMFEMFRNTKAIVLDDRGYPQGTAWPIAARLTDKESVAAASFRRPLVMSPDSTEWTTYEFVQYTPTTTKWRYHGKTVLLVDERTMSQAEHTGLFFEAANKTTIIGSPTVGANGDVTNVVLPGGVSAWFSGHEVRHADGRQLQRMGLQPDIVVRPTLAGIRGGRDEVLERALEFLKK